MEKKRDERHGSPFDRGDADAYYRRPYRPRYYKYPTDDRRGKFEEITELTDEEKKDYADGYEEGMSVGGKDWGEEE